VKRVVFCADDFGHGPAVDRGILALARTGRIAAVSCMTGRAAFAADAPALLEHRGGVELGVHVELASGRGALARILARTAIRAVRARAIEAEIDAQLDRFERVARSPPDFVDGHQHVHQLPVVRDALLAALQRRYGRDLPWVRNTVPLRPRGAKSLVIAGLGGVALRRVLRRRGIRHNRDFAGVYSLSPAAPYRALVRSWLGSVDDGALLMCHPGEGGDRDDPIAAARVAELAYLAAPELAEDCASAGVVGVKFGAIEPT
jgi:predicted glycoside hydrolase/deacetylase ChbG (UPF0249 family)